MRYRRRRHDAKKKNRENFSRRSSVLIYTYVLWSICDGGVRTGPNANGENQFERSANDTPMCVLILIALELAHTERVVTVCRIALNGSRARALADQPKQMRDDGKNALTASAKPQLRIT